MRVKDVFSKSVECSRGVPQGSVLGPLLFILYTSQMSSILPAAVCHQEFADDIIVDFSHCNPATVLCLDRCCDVPFRMAEQYWASP